MAQIANTVGWLALLALVGMPAAAEGQTAEEIFYFVTDNVGSVRIVTDTNGVIVGQYDFVPFGQNWDPASVTDPRQFAYGERGSTLQDNLDYFGARYYQARNGRFITADDTAFMDPFDPQSMNRYAYAYNNPLRWVDPSGHDGDCVAGYDSKTGQCQPAPELWGIGWTSSTFGPRPLELAKPIVKWIIAPRDPGCVAHAAGVGASVMGAAGGMIGAVGGGAGGGVLGTAALPGGGTVTLGVTGAALGFTQGTAAGVIAGGSVGGAIGSIVCMTGSSGVSFGHGGRHLAGTGIPESEVEDAIRAEVQAIRRSASSTGSFWGKVIVRGQTIVYRAFTLADGSIHIGTYTVGAP